MTRLSAATIAAIFPPEIALLADDLTLLEGQGARVGFARYAV